jgi:hypothetical protein
VITSALGKVIGEVGVAITVAAGLCVILVLAGVKGIDRLSGHHTSSAEVMWLATVAVPAVVGLIFAVLGLAGHHRRPSRGERNVSAACRFWAGAALIAIAAIGLAVN